MKNKSLIIIFSFIFILFNQLCYAVTFTQVERNDGMDVTEVQGVFKNTNIEKAYHELLFNTDNVVQGNQKDVVNDIIKVYKKDVEEVSVYSVSYDSSKAVISINHPYSYREITLIQKGKDVVVTLKFGL